MDNLLLLEDFKNEDIDKRLKWFCPPKQWEVDRTENRLVVKTEKETDFWQKTHYGFQVDNGHFLYCEMEGNFRVTTKIHSYPVHKYDQAGLMVRFSKDTWIKSSVEYIPDANNKLGAVVTNNGYSDWSTQEINKGENSLYFRISRISNDFYVDYSADGLEWKQLRMTHLFEQETKPILVGLYACSPQGEGYEAHFDFIKFEALSSDRTKVYG